MAGPGIKQKPEGKNPFELIEEAFHLLRLAPAPRWPRIISAACLLFLACSFFGRT